QWSAPFLKKIRAHVGYSLTNMSDTGRNMPAACVLRPCKPRSGDLRFLHEKRRLIGAGSPTSGDSHIQQAQVNAKLATMLVPVAEHDVAQKLTARLSKNFVPLANHAPRFVHVGVIEFGKQVANGHNVFVEGFQNLLTARGLREAGELGRLRRIVLHEANDAPGNESELVGELSG